MSRVRPAAVAGSFYPADKAALTALVGDCFEQSESLIPLPLEGSQPLALIAPHAGLIYSGPIAASAYRMLVPIKHLIKRIVLLGPSHRIPFKGIATSSADFYETPLGSVALDRESIDTISTLRQVGSLDQAHALEHSVEVHLPFLQSILDSFTFVPLVVGDASPEAVAEVIEALWDESSFTIISSDLSHYHPYEEANHLDKQTTDAIVALQEKPLVGAQACGCRPINGLLAVARHKHLSVHTIDVRNSGDTAGDKQRVVGYGAYVFSHIG